MINSINLHYGACQPNPGSWCDRNLCKRRWPRRKFSIPLNGTVTNNIAEYKALIFSLQLIKNI